MKKNVSIEERNVSDRYLNGYYEASFSAPVVIEYINSNFCSMLGYSKETIRSNFGNYYGLMIVPEDREDYMAFRNSLQKEPSSKQMKYRMIASDGSIKHVLESTTSVLLDGAMKAYSNVTDITGMLADYADSNAMLDYMKKSGIATFEFHSGTLKLDSSKELNELLGYELKPNWYMQIHQRIGYHPEFEYQKLLNAYTEVLIQHIYNKVELMLDIPEKGLRWITISIIPLIGGNEEIVGVFGTVEDTTDIHIANEIEAIQNGVIHDAISKKYPISVSLNLTQKTYKIVFGHSFIDAAGKSDGSIDELLLMVDRKLPDDRKKEFMDVMNVENVMKAYENGERTVTFDYNNEAEDFDDIICYHMELSFIDDSKGGDVYGTIVMEDVTDIMKKELLLEREYKFTIENMPGYVCKWRFEKDDIILVEANRGYYEFMETTPEEAQGRSIIYGFSDVKKHEVLDLFYAQEKNHMHIHYTGTAISKAGHKNTVKVHGTYFGEENGKSIYYCVVTDISAVEHLKEEMARKEKELILAANAGEVTVLEYLVKERKIEILSAGDKSNRIYELSGHSPEYAFEQKIVPFIDDSSFYDAFVAIEHGSPNGSVEFAIEKYDEIKWYSGQYNTIFDEDGKPESAVFSINDTTNLLASDALKLIESVAFDFLNKVELLLIVNLETGYIEHEAGNAMLLSSEEVITYEEFKNSILKEDLVDDGDVQAWLDFLDRERLIDMYRKGKVQEQLKYRCKFNKNYFNEHDMEVHVKVQKNSYDKTLRAYILFEDLREFNTEEEKEHLIEETQMQKPENVSIRTFGHFDVFVNGKAVIFQSKKAKEMLAVLVDRQGGFVEANEMVGYLWENDPSNKASKARCRQTAARMNRTLEEYGIGYIVENTNGKRRVIPEMVECDYFNYMTEREKYQHLFTGSYMADYSWGEYTLGSLENEKSVF